MSINSDENLPSIDSPEPESPTSLLKDEPMEAIHFSPSSIHVTAEADLINKQYDTKTIDFSDNDITEDEQLNTKRRSELKLLLALSKEANLETNISYKRKSLDPVKLKEMTSTPPKSSSETEQLAKKARIVEKTDKFPITAESELESMVVGESSNNDDMPTPEKLKKEEPKVKDGGVGDERKNIKDFKMFKPNKDIFCWRCHREGVNICCETCPRSYHQKCLKQTISNVENWPCPECVAILKAESTQTRSPAMKGMTLEHLCSLLKFAVKRMIECNGSEPFLHPVNDKDFPEYKKYIIQPMNLTLLEKNIKENLYGSTQAFEADAKWILHNSIIFNSYQSKLTTFAKTIMKICKQEMAEIENCPSCYLNANTKKSTWFVEVCPKPHILVWAKLKGFPYWPAKAMCVNSSGMVDVRFFGAHDRAWVPSKECFLYSRRDPNSNKQKRNDIIECMREVEVYISNIKALYGEFNYAPFKLPYDPENELKQLLLFIPRFKPNAPPPKKRCRLSESRSKSSVKKDEVDVKDENEPEAKETNKESMEGYGTDDEMNDSTVDTNKRTMMLRRHADSNLSKEIEDEEEEEEASEDSDSEEEESEDKIDPEVDDDTQVSSNSPTETLLRGNVRTRGGLNASIGKIKIIPRKISEESSPRKRLSSDETYSPSKTSRRNSDQSVKSDSSRLSSLSDKINRVDMSENVELTLGNSSESYITSSTNDTETKKKPVQIDVELSISPQNKVKITDRIMKKLSSSDEDISKSSPNKENEVKSQTDIILERYKNLVKKKSKEFASVEASTSFGSTSISSKDLCESSSNIDGITSEEKVKTDSKESDKDIECTYKNDEGKASISQKIESSNELVISSTENISPPEEMEEISKPEARRISAENPHDSSTEDEDDEKAKDTTKRDSTSETRVNTDILDGAVTTNVISETIPEKIMSSNIHAPEKEKEEISSNCEDEEVDETHCKKEGNSPIKCKLGAVISAKILQSKMKEKPEQEVISKSEGKDEINSATETKSRTQNIVEKSLTTTGKNDGETDCISITHTNSEVVGNSTETEPSDSVVKIAISKKDKKFQVKEITSTKIKILPKEVTLEKIEPESKKRDKEEFVDNKSAKAIEHTDSNSSDDQDVVLDDTQIDETNIRNIIHSSLNRVGGLKRPIEETTNDKKSIERNEDGTTETSKEPQDTQIQKKPRTHDEENEKLSISQNFKIVPIQAILNKSTDTVSTDQSLIMNNPILLKKLSQKDSETNVSNEQGMVCVEIKSEPESSDEEAEESEYMEKKRKYMSALNISEKTDEVSAPKKHVIRTRSKAEVMESIRQIDNLSRVIEEVATTFSAKHEAKKTNDRKITNQPPSNSQMLEEKKRASVQENGEIYVKSFAKLPQQQTISRVIQARPLQKSKSSSFAVKTNPQPIRKETPQKTEMAPTTLTRIVSTPNVTTTNSQNPPVPVSVANKPIDSLSSLGMY
ncbi:hypothetical protein HHI36_004090 [Cryptolaemus montrouzieri]|uniref:Protein kinase C-binding protein 1 n=1 Tax=Cryptolaemus montrouzieri TaxID=559131 RepID=A0ABD2NQS4_9CUCU